VQQPRDPGLNPRFQLDKLDELASDHQIPCPLKNRLQWKHMACAPIITEIQNRGERAFSPEHPSDSFFYRTERHPAPFGKPGEPGLFDWRAHLTGVGYLRYLGGMNEPFFAHVGICCERAGTQISESQVPGRSFLNAGKRHPQPAHARQGQSITRKLCHVAMNYLHFGHLCPPLA
jgi:hypothetical protein